MESDYRRKSEIDEVHEVIHHVRGKRNVYLNPNPIKHLYYDETWLKISNKYDPLSLLFSRNIARVYHI